MSASETNPNSDVSRKPAEAPAHTAAGGMVHPLARLRGEMDRLFDEMLGGRRWPMSLVEDLGRPAPSSGNGLLEVKTDVSETEDAIEIVAEMPGVAEEDIGIELSGELLTIKGEKKQETEEKKKDYYRCERSFGSFQRSFAVPPSVDRDAIAADFDKGVLHVTMPKKPEAKGQAKKIPLGRK